MQYLCSIAEEINNNKDNRAQCQYHVNTSLSKFGDEYRYVDYNSNKEGIRKYNLQKTPTTPELEIVLDLAYEGFGTSKIVEVFSEYGINEEHSQDYLNTLIDNQVLVCDFEPRVSGPSYFNELIEKTWKDITDTFGKDSKVRISLDEWGIWYRFKDLLRPREPKDC